MKFSDVFFRIVRFRQKIHKHVSHHFVKEIRGHTFSTHASMAEGRGDPPKCVYISEKRRGVVAFCAHASRQTLIRESHGFQQTQICAFLVGNRNIMLLPVKPIDWTGTFFPALTLGLSFRLYIALFWHKIGIN